mgnify:CR=1 FL=1
MLDNMKSELNILQITAHPNLVEVIELIQNQENIMIVSELCKGGDLYDRLN